MASFVLFLQLQVADALITLYILNTYGVSTELNPVAFKVIEELGVQLGTFSLKLLAMLCGWFLHHHQYKVALSFLNGCSLLVVLAGIYVLVSF